MIFIYRIFLVFWILSVPWNFILQLQNACAQIVTDGTMGAAASLSGPDYAVSSDLGQQIGGNLFHSFETFDINTGESATFSGPAGIQNIISRVTGGSASFIDGVLRSGISGVDFFFLNPAGVMFGPNASLDISGSFHVSTADYLRLSDNGRFDASDPQNSVLTSALPEAFGFLGENPSTAISVEGTLWAPQGETLSVVGGDITVTGGILAAQGGRINVAAVNSTGEVNIDSMDMSGFDQLGNIEMTDSSYIYASDSGGGDIYIRGNHFEINNSHVRSETLADQDGGVIDIRLNGNLAITDDATIYGCTIGGGEGNDISIETDTLTITNGSYIDGASYGIGNAGDMSINVNTLTITNDAALKGFVYGNGQGTDITINAEESVMINESAKILSVCLFDGDAGSLTVSTPQLTITDGGTVYGWAIGDGKGLDINIDVTNLEISNGATIDTQVAGNGDGGTLSINAENAVMISGQGDDGTGIDARVASSGSGSGGHLMITSDTLTIQEGGQIQTQTQGSGHASQVDLDVRTLELTDGGTIVVGSSSSGQGGDLNIHAEESVNISGTMVLGDDGSATPGGIYAYAPNVAGLDASQIDIVSKTLNLADGGLIGSLAMGDGQAADISIQASESVTISGFQSGLSSKIDSITSGSGDAGDIKINTQTLTLTGTGGIGASSHGSGKAGDIDLNVSSLILQDGGMIDAGALDQGNGGNITVSALECIEISGYFEDSSSGQSWDTFISTLAWENGNAGTISLSAPLITLTDKGKIDAFSFGNGNAGDIDIACSTLTLDGNGTYINTDIAGSGNGGDITIITDQLTITDGAGISADVFGIDPDTIEEFNATWNIDFSTGTGEATGQGGTLSITATDSVIISGTNDDGYNSSSLSTSTGSSGNGGYLFLSAPNVIVSSGGGIMAYTTNEGNGGDIQIEASLMDMQTNAAISAQSTGIGQAGSLFIQTDDSISLHNSSITTESLDADGGNITLDTVNHLYLLDSRITTSVHGGLGNGGNIDIDPCFVVLKDSQIIANAFEGNGGNIHIVSDYFLAGSESTVMASSQLGIDGTVQIDSPDTDISGRLSGLKIPDLDVTALLHSSCALKTMDTSSSLIVTGRGGLPSEPDDFMSTVYFDFDDVSEEVPVK